MYIREDSRCILRRILLVISERGVNFSIYCRVSSVKHLAPAEGEVEVVEVEELSNGGSRANGCTSDVECNFVDQVADDPDEVDKSEVEENQSNGQSGLNKEESGGSNDVNSNEEHDEAVECPKCGKHMKSNDLSAHIKEDHEGFRKRRCFFCHILTRSSLMSEHIKTAHPQKKCPYCPKTAWSRIYNLDVHIRGVHQKCPHCPKLDLVGLDGRSKLKAHIRTVHQGRPLVQDIRWKCPLCPKLVAGRKLNAHVRKVHAGIKKKCPHCPKDFAVGDLRNHIKAGHSAASKG